MISSKHYLFDIKTFDDGSSGCLSVLECVKDIPFEVKRVFYEYGVVDSAVRGKHANKNSRFCLICLAGSCKVSVDDGNGVVAYRLSSPRKGLFLDTLIWKEMSDFSPDCVLLVLSDHHYDADEYIANYSDYRKLIG